MALDVFLNASHPVFLNTTPVFLNTTPVFLNTTPADVFLNTFARLRHSQTIPHHLPLTVINVDADADVDVDAADAADVLSSPASFKARR